MSLLRYTLIALSFLCSLSCSFFQFWIQPSKGWQPTVWKTLVKTFKRHSYYLSDILLLPLLSFSSFIPQKSTTEETKALPFIGGVLHARNCWNLDVHCLLSPTQIRKCKHYHSHCTDKETEASKSRGLLSRTWWTRIQIQLCLASKLQLHHSAFREKFLSN